MSNRQWTLDPANRFAPEEYSTAQADCRTWATKPHPVKTLQEPDWTSKESLKQFVDDMRHWEQYAAFSQNALSYCIDAAISHHSKAVHKQDDPKLSYEKLMKLENDANAYDATREAMQQLSHAISDERRRLTPLKARAMNMLCSLRYRHEVAPIYDAFTQGMHLPVTEEREAEPNHLVLQFIPHKTSATSKREARHKVNLLCNLYDAEKDSAEKERIRKQVRDQMRYQASLYGQDIMFRQYSDFEVRALYDALRALVLGIDGNWRTIETQKLNPVEVVIGEDGVLYLDFDVERYGTLTRLDLCHLAPTLSCWLNIDYDYISVAKGTIPAGRRLIGHGVSVRDYNTMLMRAREWRDNGEAWVRKEKDEF